MSFLRTLTWGAAALSLVSLAAPGSAAAFAQPDGRGAAPEAADPTPSPAEPTPDVTPAPWPFPNVPMPEAWPLCRTWYPDCDQDGHADPGAGLYTCWNPNLSLTPPACKYMRVADDCDDNDALVSPDAEEGPQLPETTVDGIDNDCDGFVDVDCDGDSGLTAPRILIDTPARGTFTQAQILSVRGLVLPGITGRDILPVSVGGQQAAMELCSSDGGVLFSADVPLVHGVQTVNVWVQDTDGKGDEAMVGVAQSDSFVDLSTSRLEGSLISLLNQGSWNILSDYLESYLSASELQAELLAQNPLISDSGSDDCIDRWEIYGEATGYTHDDMQVSFVVSNGVIRTTARLVHPQIWATGWAYYDLEWYCGGWDDRVGLNAYASFSEVAATANGRLSLDANGVVQVVFTEVSVNASGAYINVDADNSLYDWLIDLFEDDMADELESFVEDELYSYVATDLGPDLAAELNGLDLSYTVSMSGVDYGVDFNYDTLNVREGGVDLGFDMGVSYTRDPRVAANPGAVHFGTSYSVDSASTLGFRVGLDFFNGSLHALWDGGSLHLEDTLSEEPLIRGAASPLLPPVIVPGAAPWLLELRLADVMGALDVTLPDGSVQTVQVALATTVPMSLTATAQGYVLTFDVGFGASQVEYDLLGFEVLPQGLEEATEAAMSDLLDLLLVELEGYLESLEISYLGVPMVITGLDVRADVGNPAMIAVDAQAVYTGP